MTLSTPEASAPVFDKSQFPERVLLRFRAYTPEGRDFVRTALVPATRNSVHDVLGTQPHLLRTTKLTPHKIPDTAFSTESHYDYALVLYVENHALGTAAALESEFLVRRHEAMQNVKDKRWDRIFLYVTPQRRSHHPSPTPEQLHRKAQRFLLAGGSCEQTREYLRLVQEYARLRSAAQDAVTALGSAADDLSFKAARTDGDATQEAGQRLQEALSGAERWVHIHD